MLTLLSQLGSAWHLLCSWLVLDGLWCWIGTHHVHCERHPPILSQLIAPTSTVASQWLPFATQPYTTATSEEVKSVCLSLLLYGFHVWRRLAEECIFPSQHHRGRSLPSGARMHLAHYLFGMSFCQHHRLRLPFVLGSSKSDCIRLRVSISLHFVAC